MKCPTLAAPLAVLASFMHVAHAVPPGNPPRLRVLGTHDSGLNNVGGAEIPAYDPITRRSFVVNAGSATVDVLDLRNPNMPTKLGNLDLVADLAPRSVGAASGVDARFGILAVAVEADPGLDDGWVAFYSTLTLELLAVVPAGALPADARIYGPGASVAQDLEPEYITTDGQTAWVTLQEANAIAVIDIRTARVQKVFALGFKDHSRGEKKLDASDDDGRTRIRRSPVFGMYQPDAIANFRSGDRHYLITANEGDTRDHDGYSEEERVADLALDPVAFPNAAMLREDANLGRLTVTTAHADTDGDGDFDRLYVPGARSFSIWNARTGKLVFDSGAELEQLLADLLPEEFNANHEENDSLDDRSDNKGPEPEGLTLGMVKGRLYAFIGLERIGGILMLDLTDPHNPEFVDYLDNRAFRDAAGDLGPEGPVFVPARQAPRGKPLWIVSNEVSGDDHELRSALSGRRI